jgi:hypothetical protein
MGKVLVSRRENEKSKWKFRVAPEIGSTLFGSYPTTGLLKKE